jgi:hypothetical protein
VSFLSDLSVFVVIPVPDRFTEPDKQKANCVVP